MRWNYGLWLLLCLFMTACAVNSAERNNAGKSAYDAGEYDESLKAYQVAQVTAPDSPIPYYNAALTLAQMGRLNDAVVTLEQSLKTADSELTAKAYYNLGNIYFQMGLYDQAVQAYQQTLLLRPNDENARYNLELALSRLIPPSAQPFEATPPQDAGATPTNNPEAPDSQLSTPSPQPASPTPEPDTSQPNVESTMSAEEAQRLLDSVQQDQSTLQDQLQAQPLAPVESAEDW
jgi:tetratricopeptide (TPR) repeat protein